MTFRPATVIFICMLAWMTLKPATGVGQSHSKSIKITTGKKGRKIVTGKASHYSRNLDGTKTAIGTRYRNNKLTAASNFFKLRTWVRVTRISNERSVVVYINDRMHRSMAAKGRVIDLSVAAAERLRFMGSVGITKVKVEEISKSEALEEMSDSQSTTEN